MFSTQRWIQKKARLHNIIKPNFSWKVQIYNRNCSLHFSIETTTNSIVNKNQNSLKFIFFEFFLAIFWEMAFLFNFIFVFISSSFYPYIVRLFVHWNQFHFKFIEAAFAIIAFPCKKELLFQMFVSPIDMKN